MNIYVNENEKEYIFRCPLHEDKRGHLYVSKRDGKYICFKCGTKGHNILMFFLKHQDLLTENDNSITTKLINQMFSGINGEKSETNREILNRVDENAIRKLTTLYKELRYELTKNAVNNVERIIEYLQTKRKIYDVDYINELLEKDTFGYHEVDMKNHKKVQMLLKEIYGKPVLYRESIAVFLENFGIQFRYIDDGQYKSKYMTFVLKDVSNVFKTLEYHRYFMIDRSHNPLPIIFIVEGVFDGIKLDYLLQQSNTLTSYKIISILGKTNVKTLQLIKPTNMYIISLDSDVTKSDIINVYNNLPKLENTKVYVMRITNPKYKDFDEMEDLQDFKKNTELVQFEKYITDLWKLQKFFDSSVKNVNSEY